MAKIKNFEFYNKHVTDFEFAKGTSWNLCNSFISFRIIEQYNKCTSYTLKFWFITFKLFWSSQVSSHFHIELKFTIPFTKSRL